MGVSGPDREELKMKTYLKEITMKQLITETVCFLVFTGLIFWAPWIIKWINSQEAIMLDKMHSEYSRWLAAAKINQAEYEKGDDQRAIEVNKRTIATIEAKLKKLEEQGACL